MDYRWLLITSLIILAGCLQSQTPSGINNTYENTSPSPVSEPKQVTYTNTSVKNEPELTNNDLDIGFKNIMTDNFICHLIVEFDNLETYFIYDFKFYKSGDRYRTDVIYKGFKDPQTNQDIEVSLIYKYRLKPGTVNEYDVSGTINYMGMSNCNRTTIKVENNQEIQNPQRYIDLREIEYKVVKQECQSLDYDPKIFELDC